MKFAKIEDVMYIARLNLFDYRTNFGDWRDAKVVQIVNNQVTLRHKDGREQTWTLHELEKFCHELHEDHFAALYDYVKKTC